jgi:hypothetical protein
VSAALAGLATLAFIVVGGIVGVRLLLLSRRTRQLPEFAVGLSLFLLSAVSYPASLVVMSAPVGLGAARALSVLAVVAMGVGWAAVYVFTWRTFRPGSAPVRALALLAAAAILGLAGVRLVRVVATDVLADLSGYGAPVITIQILALAAYAWTAAEGLRYHALMRRRLALGLADPVVANRFLLWGLTGVSAFLTVAGSTVALLSGAGYDAIWLRWLTAVGGTGAAVCLYLAFLPPQSWRERLARQAPSSASA